MSRILKYNEAKLKIARMISDRNLKVGDRLPSERELAKQLGVSIISIRRAFEELKDAGILERRQGVGSFFTGNVTHSVYSSKLGVISIRDPRFPAGEDVMALRESLHKYGAEYQVFNVNEDVDMSIASDLATCDRFIVSGFVNLPWLDFLFSQGKPLVEIGTSEHNRKVCSVKFDWETAFDRAVSRLAAAGRKRLGLLLIHPSAANCSYERSRIFLRKLSEYGLSGSEEVVRFIIPECALAHIDDYMRTYGRGLDALLIDYHVFNLWSFSALMNGFSTKQELVVLQTTRELRDEVNILPRFSHLYFPDTIMDNAIDILYDNPYSFIEHCETYRILPEIQGHIGDTSKFALMKRKIKNDSARRLKDEKNQIYSD